jgi:2',3'-cyclic-nucleotide 2'-phosphodiesterase / 3'-nucleotidase
MTTPQQPQQQPVHTGRRAVVTGAAAAGIAVTATVASGSPAEAGTGGSTTRRMNLTVLGTTDLHGNV